MTARVDRRDVLFDLLVSHPNGMTLAEVELLLPARTEDAKHAIHDLRLFLGEFDNVNLPCTPPANGSGQWTYRLTGKLDDCREWVANRIKDSESRLRVMEAMMSSLVRATDGRQSDGKVVRIMEKGLRRIIEDLDDLADAS